MYSQNPKNQLEEVKSTLVNSYVDDISVNITVADIHKELNTPTLLINSKNPFKSLPITEQAALLTVAKTQRVLAILDFSSFSAKQVKSTLVNSYVDDISVNTTVADLHKELNNPTLIMDSKNPFSSLPMIEQAALLTVAKTQRVLAILDFSGF